MENRKRGSQEADKGVSEKEIRRIARLVRLRISDEEVALYRSQLADVVSWFGMLARVETAEVVPATNGGCCRALPLRSDHNETEDIRNQVLANAPEYDMGFFTVKKVIE